MLCVIYGLALSLYGKQMATNLVELSLSSVTFLVALGYAYEVLKLQDGSSVLIAGLTACAAFAISKRYVSQNIVASLGVIVGITCSLFMISLLDL